MELAPRNIVTLNRSRYSLARVRGVGESKVLARWHGRERMHEVHHRARFDVFEHTPVPSPVRRRKDPVPADLRHLPIRFTPNLHHTTRYQTETDGRPELFALVQQKLHTEADAQDRSARSREQPDRL